ncbi:MAG: hypothetical protein IJQ45_04535 [Clostridia bacterium]|nr:hypothetical protein [Clostridia bacterium]
MKKKNFETRLANDLFPETPSSFEAGLKKTMQEAGIQTKKSLSATGVFAGAIGFLAAAACLVIVLIGVMGGGRSGKSNAAAPGETTSTPQMAQPTPREWKGDTKVIALSSGFDFENAEKFQALYTGVLSCLRERGESEPDELWLCAIKSRYVAADTGDRADGYLSGYYVLVQHSFGPDEGPELYCLSEDFEVLWCTEGSATGPNHAVNPEEDNYTGTYQGHFLYGTEPRIPEPGVPHVTRGALVGSEPGTDVEFSMAASITKVEERLQGSAHLDAAKEFFLITVSAHDWDSFMKNPILRFETLEGPVDVNMEKLPLVGTVQNIERPQPTPIAEVQGVEHWLSQNQPLIRDFTDDWYGETAVQQYAEAVRRALLVSGEHIQDELWICGVAYDWENEDGAPPTAVYVLALNAGDGEPSPELFYYENGRILWMTQGASDERINVVHHHGNTIVFGKSPAFDNRPLPMTYGKVVLTDGGSDSVAPILRLEEIQERITGGPYYSSARECFLWMEWQEVEPRTVTVAAQIDGKIKEFTLDKVNSLTPMTVPAMAVRSDGVVYPGKVTHLAHARNENGLAADGSPLMDKLQGTTFEEIKIVRMRDRALPWEIITISDNVTVERVEVYSESLERLHTYAELSVIDTLPPGKYYLCFHTTTLGPYSETIGRYTYRTDFTIFKVNLP